jgi:type IV secretory pathway TraG/TraD family ATPase VirD4
MGPDYKDKVIVLEGGRRPARLKAVKAFEDPSLSDRFGRADFHTLAERDETAEKTE